MKETTLRGKNLSKELVDSVTIDTIYFGGGTPSCLPVESIGKIKNCIDNTFNVRAREITMEMNPDDVTPELIRSVKAMGVNRISIGIQTFNDVRLKFIHRRHTSETAIAAVGAIREAGIENISIDLMFGFPDESMDEWRYDIKKAIELNPTHISAYCLMYEEGTLLHRLMELGKVKPIDEDTYLAMYSTLIDTLENNGYIQYEISNFAREGYMAIHNSSYWQDVPYIGLGASAHSYLKDRRCWNVDNLNEYIIALKNGVLPSEYEIIDARTHYNDLVTTAMRTREGLNLEVLPDKYRRFALENAAKNIGNKLLELRGNHLCLTRKGLFVSDAVMSDLIMLSDC